jgi:hypothetical protein
MKKYIMPTVKTLDVNELGDLLETSPFQTDNNGNYWQGIHDDDEPTDEEGRARQSIWD